MLIQQTSATLRNSRGVGAIKIRSKGYQEVVWVLALPEGPQV